MVAQPSPSPAVDELASTLYAELRRLAHGERRRGGAGDTLRTTALVHEAYLRLAGRDSLQFDDPRQFFAYAGRAMRHILLDRARDCARLKAGGDQIHVSLTHTDLPDSCTDPAQVLALEQALNELEADHPRAAQVVELHYFAGLTLERTAELLGIVRRTVDRDWRYARAFLMTRLDC
jgi:RNA polymerase sigma factor (TIGR02999 family)